MPRRNTRGPKAKPGGSRGSNYGRFNTKKKKSKGKTNNHRGSANVRNNGPSGMSDFPELMDLNESIHIPAENSMRNLSKRPGRLMKEAMYTEKHQAETMSQSFRDRPIEFVKATETYNPHNKIKELLQKGTKGSSHENTTPAEVESQVQTVTTINDVSHVDDQIEFEKFNEYIRKLTSPAQEGVASSSSPETMKADQNCSPDIRSEITLIPKELEISHYSRENKNVPKDINNPHVPPENQELLDILNSPDKPKPTNDTILTFSSESEDSEEETTPESLPVENLNISEPEFIIDEEGDINSSVKKPDISRIISNSRSSVAYSEESTSPTVPLEHESVLTIGKVSLRTSTDKYGNVTTQLPSEKVPDSEDESDLSANEGYRDYINSIMRDMRDNSDDEDDGYISSTNFDIMASSSEEEEEEEEDESDEEDDKGKDPEYGFLPEDFEFDVSQISITNVRYGIQNSLYTRNLELTGSPDTYQWIDQEEVVDYVISKGVKQHRIASFLKYVTGGLIDQKQDDEPEYSDVYISESEEDEVEDVSDDTSQEGDDVTDLIAFNQTQKRSFAIEDVQTQSIQTKGKGRKKQLDIDRFDLDNEIRESLQEQFQIHRDKKKKKKSAKEEERIQKGLNSHDLLVKYPYTLHIRDIRDEMELFLHDSNRDSVSFPPLDPHGSKVVSRMAKCYNFSSKKCGPNGIHSYVKVTKSRKTFHYLPRYDEIGHILKQRPIFNRTDQKRPKDEITASDGNLKKDKSRGRNKSSMTVIKEGEIVGGTAPEIGKDNIGRQLLEKLGWIKGEGLGAHGNKGISEPLLATMKKSKTGLK